MAIGPLHAPSTPPPRPPRRWPLMWVDAGGCGGRVWDAPSPRIGCHRSASGGGRTARRPPRQSVAPRLPSGSPEQSKIRHGIFFFFCEAPRPNRIRSADNFRVFFCQGCQGCPIGMKWAKTPQNRCCFFFGVNFLKKILTVVLFGNSYKRWFSTLQAWVTPLRRLGT